jgi:hypothetical protein
MFAHGETVTRQRAKAVTDPYSGESVALDWSTPLTATISGCGFNPGGTSEQVQTGRIPVVTRPEVYAPAGSDIRAQDRLVVRGKTYEVDGEPAAWRSPFTGWEPGLVVSLKIVEG